MIDPVLFRETCRYLGVGDRKPDESMEQLIETAISRVKECAKFRCVYQNHAVSVSEQDVEVCCHFVHSHALAQHLCGCEHAWVFAATLGSDVDRLLMRDMVLQPSLAMAEQAAAAALIEYECDRIMLKLEDALQPDEYLLSRFSPGYDDFDLSEQEFLIDILQAPKSIGLTCTGSSVLSPIKSITAVIGVSHKKGSCLESKCDRCSNKDCIYRK